MRIALISDLHRNIIVLGTVLANLQRRGPADEVWILSDLAAMGYDPVGALERLSELPNARFVRRNTEEHITSGTLGGAS